MLVNKLTRYIYTPGCNVGNYEYIGEATPEILDLHFACGLVKGSISV